MTRTLVTQISRVRYDELITGWLDGSLKEEWVKLENTKLTKAKQVEERQIKAIAMIISNNDIFNSVKEKPWNLIKVYKEANGTMSIELLG